MDDYTSDIANHAALDVFTQGAIVTGAIVRTNETTLNKSVKLKVDFTLPHRIIQGFFFKVYLPKQIFNTDGN